MRRRWLQVSAISAMGALALATAGMTPHAEERAWQTWQAELAALHPREPLAYIEIAEEMLDAAHSEDDERSAELRELAQHLFALAGALDPSRYGRSACLALASMTEDRAERDRLHALADLLPSRDVLRAWQPDAADEPVPATTALALSEALGYYRQGYGNRALSLLEKHNLDAVLTRFGELLPGGPERFLEDCRHYTNGRKPALFEGGVARMLVLESALLAGTERSWAGEVMLTAALPLIEIDPSELDEMLGVDASRPYFVNGTFEPAPAP